MEKQVYELANLDPSSKEPLQENIEFVAPKIQIKRSVSKFLQHTGLMLKKNYIIMGRNKKITFFQLFSPVLVCLLIIFWQYLANIVTDFSEIEPPTTPTPKISKCIPPDYSSECVTVGYGIAVSSIPLQKRNYLIYTGSS